MPQHRLLYVVFQYLPNEIFFPLLLSTFCNLGSSQIEVSYYYVLNILHSTTTFSQPGAQMSSLVSGCKI